MKRIACLLLSLFFLMINGIPAFANGDNSNILESRSAKELANRLIPKNATEIPSYYSTSFVEQRDGHVGSLGERASADASTYQLAKGGDEDFLSIVVVEFLDKVSISKDDLLEVSVNDYLRPISPEYAWVYTRGDSSSKWRLKGSAVPYPTGSGVRLFGSELQGTYNQVMILLCFPSLNNPERVSLDPIYNIEFTHYKKFTPILPIVAIVAILCVVTFFILRKYRYNNQRKEFPH